MSTGIYRMALEQAAQVAANGSSCTVVDAVRALAPSEATRCLIVDQEQLDAAVDALHSFPRARVVALCSELDPATLAATLREPRVAALLSDGFDGPRPWEVAYAVRRCLSPGPPVPLGALFHWAHTKVSFLAGTELERDRTTDAVRTVARRFGLTKPAARDVMRATAHLVDAALRRAAAVAPTTAPPPGNKVRIDVVIDAESFGVEVADPHGSLSRTDVFGALLRQRHERPQDADTWDLTKLHDHSSLLRFFVEPQVSTRVAFVVQRGTKPRDVASIHWEERDPNHVAGHTPRALPRVAGQEQE